MFDQEYPATPELAFRRQALESMIPIAWCEKALKETEIEAVGVKILGIDPAEYGEDSTVFIMRQGRVVENLRRYHKRGPMEIVGLAASCIDEWTPDFINVDAGGIGSGVADRLAELGYPVTRVLFGERALEPELYAIRKDEMGGEMKTWFEAGPVRITVDEKERDALKADICGPSFTHDSSRRLKVESKEHMKRRGLKSPDAFDALGLTFAVPCVPTAKRSRVNRTMNPTNWRAA
jgi:hypothetical protein